MEHPAWKHYLALLERVFEQQAKELATGLPHDKYLIQCGAVYALQRMYDLPDQIIAKSRQQEEMKNVQSRLVARDADQRTSIFLNTPWWDQYIRDTARATFGEPRR